MNKHIESVNNTKKKAHGRFDLHSTASFFGRLGKDYIEAATKDYEYIYSRTKLIIEPYLTGRVLNVGSGGIDLPLNANVDCVVSLDLSKTLLKFHKIGTGRSVVCGESRQMPFRLESFDAVIAHFALHHFAQYTVKVTFNYVSDTLTCISKMIRAGGKLIIAENTVSGELERLQRILYPSSTKLLSLFNRPPVYLFSVKTLTQLCEERDFKIFFTTSFKAESKALILPCSIPKLINPISISLLTAEKR